MVRMLITHYIASFAMGSQFIVGGKVEHRLYSHPNPNP